MNYALLFSVFIIAACGLVYELIAGALSSYLLGDSITQFSTVIGSYLFAMGIGSYLSRHVKTGLIARFIHIELMVGLLGGYSAAILFLLFAYLAPFKLVLYLLIILLGILVGLEIPLVMRILKQQFEFSDLISQVLSVDYLGALAVSLLFPLVLAPHLGLIRTALLFGLLNVLVAGWTAWLFRAQLPQHRYLQAQCLTITLVLLTGFITADRLTALAEEKYYAEEIIYTKSTPYQRLVLTRWQDDIRLYLNGNLQFSSRDEYRYHEALVHPGLQAIAYPRRVLVLGGGDGLAVREVLKYPTIEAVTLVDLDPAMTKLFSTHPLLTQLNQNSLTRTKVHIVNADAFVWLDQNQESFDFVVVDFPDPSNYALGKLYTTTFYRLLKRHLSQHGAIVIQSTSPLYARRSFWSVVKTLESEGLQTNPYHAYVPSFGEWGFILASFNPYQPPTHYINGLKYISSAIAPTLFQFPGDMGPVNAEVNRLNNQILVRYFEAEWRQAGP